MKLKRWYTKSIFIIVVQLVCVNIAFSVEVELYRVFEISMKAKSSGNNPYVDGPEVTATFSGVSGKAKGKTYVVSGFWDGDNVWKIRFAPTFPGKWSFITSSSDPGLNKQKGYLTALLPKKDQLSSNILYHGFLELNDTFSWRQSDGTPFFPIGETQWCFSEEFFLSEWKAWMDVLHDRNYNTFMGCAWLGKYTRANIYPFQNRDPNSDQLLVNFFQEQLDPMVQYANERGIMMGIVIGGFPDNSQWFQKFNTLARNDRWFKYIIARYTAYNVRWGLFGEMDEASGKFALEDKSWQWVGKHFAELIKKNDPYKHPIGSHNTRIDTCAAIDPNINFIEVQEASRIVDTQYLNAQKCRKWNKPVWYEEYWYEMDGNPDVGILNTHSNFVSSMAFPTMGSMMRNVNTTPNGFPPVDAKKKGVSLYEYLMENDIGIKRMSYFADFYKILVNDLNKFIPSSHLVNIGQCGRFGNNYAIFLKGGGSVSINLSGVKGNFNIKRLDIRSGETANLKGISGGSLQTINSGLSSDAAILIISL